MKATFITIHVGFNFGSKLQAIATQEILIKAGCSEVVCVNYIPPRVEIKRYWKVALQNPVKFLRRALFFPLFLYSKWHYDRYLKNNCCLSDPIYSKDDFSQKCPKADVYVSGSDQLWNYKHNEGVDKHYFFDGIQGKKIAYASSIGMTKLPDDYSNYMKQALQQFTAISVRESSAVDLLAQWGIKSTQLIDPTLMLNKESWAQYASKRLVKAPYLFVYLPYNVNNKETVYNTVRKIASKNKIKVISFSWNHQKDKFADKTIIFADPGDILSLFIHADQVVTNSFHGTAFSINLNKQFWVYMPSHFSTRLQSIIELSGLKDRILEGVIEDRDINKVLDFTEANRVLGAEREKAREFIKKALS